MMKNTGGVNAVAVYGKREGREIGTMLDEIGNDIEALRVSFSSTEDLTSLICISSAPNEQNTKCAESAKCAMGDRLQTIRMSLLALRARIDDLNARIEL